MAPVFGCGHVQTPNRPVSVGVGSDGDHHRDAHHPRERRFRPAAPLRQSVQGALAGPQLGDHHVRRTTRVSTSRCRCRCRCRWRLRTASRPGLRAASSVSHGASAAAPMRISVKTDRGWRSRPGPVVHRFAGTALPEGICRCTRIRKRTDNTSGSARFAATLAFPSAVYQGIRIWPSSGFVVCR